MPCGLQGHMWPRGTLPCADGLWGDKVSSLMANTMIGSQGTCRLGMCHADPAAISVRLQSAVCTCSCANNLPFLSNLSLMDCEYTLL